MLRTGKNRGQKKKNKLLLPHHYKPRGYQYPILRAIDSGFDRAVAVWHRRAGKDKTFVNFTAKKMYQRVGSYFYLFPTYAQGRKIIWEGMDAKGYPFLNHLPESLRVSQDNQQMKIEMQNGSIFRIIGTDRVDSVVGTNPVGCVFTEYALQDPSAWDFLRPILAENKGWAVFLFTPRGKNHGWDILKLAQESENWWSQILTVEDTKAIPADVLEQERKEIIKQHGNDGLYQQEYMCSFDVPIQGAYYAQQLLKADRDGRIGGVPYVDYVRVSTAWDLGMDDATAIWFFQVVGKEIRLIDYYQNSGEGLRHYAKILDEKDYLYDQHIAPHDIKVRELGTGKSRLEVAAKLGIKFTIAPKLPLDDGIEATRRIFGQCWFDKRKCSKGISALRSYHKDWDEFNKVYRIRPVHDWSSHGSDAFRTLATGFKHAVKKNVGIIESEDTGDPYEAVPET